VAVREDWILALCSHEGRLYDAGAGGEIYETLGSTLVARREEAVLALASVGGRLYDAGEERRVYDTFAGTVLGEREEPVAVLCPHQGGLYDGGTQGWLFESITNRNVLAGRKAITAACSVPPDLFAALLARGEHVPQPSWGRLTDWFAG
jgi:hypothetical protein